MNTDKIRESYFRNGAVDQMVAKCLLKSCGEIRLCNITITAVSGKEHPEIMVSTISGISQEIIKMAPKRVDDNIKPGDGMISDLKSPYGHYRITVERLE